MIQKTIYIREVDIDKYNAIPNKAEFIHNALKNLRVKKKRTKVVLNHKT